MKRLAVALLLASTIASAQLGGPPFNAGSSSSSSGGGGGAGPTFRVNASAGSLTPSTTSGGVTYYVTLDANLSITNPSITGLVAGATLQFVFGQDSTGYRSVSWGTAFIGAIRFMPRQGPKQAASVVWTFDGTSWQLTSFDGIDTSKGFDIRDFGATLLSSDNTAAMQAAINTAESFYTPYSQLPPVYFPSTIQGNAGYSGWVQTKPLVVTTNGVQLVGEGDQQASLQGRGFDGPNILINGSMTTFPDAGSLATGGGVAIALSAARPGLLNFWHNSYFWSNSLNGFTAFTVELYAKITDETSDSNLVFFGDNAQSGGLNANHASNITVQLFVGAGGIGNNGTAVATIGGVRKTAGFHLAADSTVHHIALAYDGAHLRTFVDGVLGVSTAATGTWTSTPLQDFTVGLAPASFPAFGTLNTAPTGALDSIRISKTARYTANFTPPSAKFTQDTNTVFLCNFDQVTSPPVLVGAKVNGLQSWFPWQSKDNAGSVTNVRVKNFQLGGTGSGIAALGALNSYYDDITCLTSRCLWIDDFGFGSAVSRISGGSGPGPGLHLGNMGLSSVRDVNLIGGSLAMILGGAGDYFDNVFLSPSGGTYWGIAALGDPDLRDSNSYTSFKDVSFDMENLVPQMLGGVYLQNLQTVNVLGGAYDFSGTGDGLSPFTVSNVGSLTSTGSQFAGGSTPASIFHIAGTPAGPGVLGGNNPIVVRGGYRFKSPQPWIDTGLEQWMQVEEPGFSSGTRSTAIAFVDGGAGSATYNSSFTDEMVAITGLDAGFKVVLPPCVAAARGKIIPVKDEANGAATYNITVVVDGGGTIERASSQVISTNLGGIAPYCDGTAWFLEPPATFSTSSSAPLFTSTAAGNTAAFTVVTDTATYCLNSACTATPTGSNADLIKDDGSGDMVLQSKSGTSIQAWRNFALEGGLTSPAGLNASAGIDFSGFSGAFKTTTGAVTLSGPTTASSTKNSGTITLSGGTGTATVTSGTHCVCTDTSGLVSTGLQCTVSSTTLTATEVSGSDVIAYICF